MHSKTHRFQNFTEFQEMRDWSKVRCRTLKAHLCLNRQDLRLISQFLLLLQVVHLFRPTA